MHIAFGRVRHKTSPTRGAENVCLFFWFTINTYSPGEGRMPAYFSRLP